MKQRLAAADNNRGRSQVGQFIDSPNHYFGLNRFGKVVVFVTVSAGEIAAPNRYDMGENRMVRRPQSFSQKLELAEVGFDFCSLFQEIYANRKRRSWIMSFSKA